MSATRIVQTPMRNVITFGDSMPNNNSLPEWEKLLSSAAHLQRLLPDAVLVGGTAVATHVHHRLSYDAAHVLNDLRGHFDEILEQLESVAGWQTARIRRPVLILGSLDGIETGVRQLIREVPLETTTIQVGKETVTVPSAAEMLRIKAILILRRNATRDYLDFTAMANSLGDEKTLEALRSFDALYPQPNGESAYQQLQIQLSNPVPYDLDDVDLSEYKHLVPELQDWNFITARCRHLAMEMFQNDSSLPLLSSDAELKRSPHGDGQ